MNLKFTSFALVAFYLGLTSPAEADPRPFTLTLTGESSLSLVLSSTALGSEVVSQPMQVGGTIDAVALGVADGSGGVFLNTKFIEFEGAALTWLDTTTPTLDFGLLGTLDVSITDPSIGALATQAPIPTTLTDIKQGQINPLNPFYEYSFDSSAGDSAQFVVNEGSLVFSGGGAVFSSLGSPSIDFEVDPLVTSLNSVGQSGFLSQDPFYLAGGEALGFAVVMEIPISSRHAISGSPFGLEVGLEGLLVATGIYVPEPSSSLLLVIGLVAFIPLRRYLNRCK